MPKHGSVEGFTDDPRVSETHHWNEQLLGNNRGIEIVTRSNTLRRRGESKCYYYGDIRWPFARYTSVRGVLRRDSTHSGNPPAWSPSMECGDVSPSSLFGRAGAIDLGVFDRDEKYRLPKAVLLIPIKRQETIWGCRIQPPFQGDLNYLRILCRGICE